MKTWITATSPDRKRNPMAVTIQHYCNPKKSDLIIRDNQHVWGLIHCFSTGGPHLSSFIYIFIYALFFSTDHDTPGQPPGLFLYRGLCQ